MIRLRAPALAGAACGNPHPAPGRLAGYLAMRINKGTILKAVEQPFLRQDLPEFRPGDLVRVDYKVTEGNRTRVQAFEGTVIAIKNGGIRRSFTVRKISYGEGVERVFPLHSPHIDGIAIIERGKARRAKLYYLRGRRGKKAKIKADRTRIMREAQAQAEAEAGEGNARA